MNTKKIYYVGIMTGTSLDGIDIAVCEYKKKEGSISQRLVAYDEFDLPIKLKDKIKDIISNDISISEISQLNFALSHIYTEKLNILLSQENIDKSELACIGIHGQTVWHQPNSLDFAGQNISSTLQLASPTVLSAEFICPVVSDFRSADIALGGQGAPLVPIFDYEYLRDNSHNVVAINIGGMSNMTILKKNTSKNEVIAFDTGPGNVLIDIVAEKLFGKPYDKNGDYAREGKIITALFDKLKSISFVTEQPPKSTGRELFNISLIQEELNKSYSKYDIIHTLTIFTAYAISKNIKLFYPDCQKIILSGGGAKNSFLLSKIKEFTKIDNIILTDEIGIPSDAKEAMCFAYLAFRTMNHLPSNIISVTGAKKECVLGSITDLFTF